MWLGGHIGSVPVALLDLLYLTALGLCVANEIVAGRNWKNAPVLISLALLVAANALFHLEAAGYAILEGLAVRLSISVMAMLVSLIGGRVVPRFTRNWFAKNDGPEIVQPMGVFDKVSLVVSVAALGVWIVIAESQVAGGCLVVTGLLHLVRLARWRGWQTTGEGLVTILHVAYLWLGIGLTLLGASMLDETVTRTAALHVLTLGAMGTMILAVMTRAILGHTGRDLRAVPGTIAIYILVTAALALRVGHEFAPSVELVWASALSWTAAFGLFVWIYAPMTYRGR